MKLRFEPVRRLCQDAVANEVAPGFVVLVSSGGQLQFHEAFGWRQLVPRQLPSFPDTVYDVASLTKAVVTSVLVMKEVERGTLALDEPVTKRLPEFEGQGDEGKARAGVTLRHLLSHSAGLPAHRPYWRQAAAAASVLAAVPTSQGALAKPSMMAPPPSPTVEAAVKAEPAQPEPTKSSTSIIPEPRPSDTLSRDEIASLFKRGQDMIAGGDIASGRLMLTRAAQAGNAEASLALAGTFDAVILANLRVIGVQPDPAKARAWYMRAAEQGSLEAKRRLEQSALR